MGGFPPILILLGPVGPQSFARLGEMPPKTGFNVDSRWFPEVRYPKPPLPWEVDWVPHFRPWVMGRIAFVPPPMEPPAAQVLGGGGEGGGASQ